MQRQGRPGDAPARSLVWHLALFAAALVTPALALIVLLFWRSAEAEQARIDREVRDVAKAIAVALDRNLIARQSMVTALATAPSLQAGDYAAFHRHAGELARAEGLAFVLRDRGGQLLADTQVPWGRPLPRNVLDVDRQVVETRRPAVSNLFIGATSRQPSFAVVAPVLRHGEVVGLLSAVTPSERAVSILREGLPAELWAASFSDRNGILVARTRNHDAWVGRPITDQLRRAAVQPSGTWDGPSHEGNPLRGGYARSPESDWLVAVGVDRGRLMAPLHRMLWLTGAAVVALGGLSALLAAVFGRRINRSILALAGAATDLGRTGTFTPVSSSVAEVNSVSNSLVEAARRLSAAQDHQRLLLGELNHRVKNMLATVQGIANQSFQGVATAEARQAFENRLVSLARTHDLLTRRNWQDAGLRDVVLQALAPFQGVPAPRFDIDGSGDVRLPPKAALALSMALHELATNAVKYGALSNGSGRVSVSWEVADEGLRLSWREAGGPPVRKPERRGFGSIMIERGLARDLGAEVSVDFAPDGLAFRMSLGRDQQDLARAAEPA